MENVRKNKHRKIFLWIIGIVVILFFTAVLLYFLNPSSFPPRVITFSQGIGNLQPENVTKIEIRSGKGKLKSTTDQKKIKNVMKRLSNQTFHRNPARERIAGWEYSIDFYPKNQSGFNSYTLDIGFCRFRPGWVDSSLSCQQGLISGRGYEPEHFDQVESILSDFFSQLS